MTDILVADIGGTNARFAVAQLGGGGDIHISEPQSFRAEDYESIGDATNAYLESVSANPRRAAFAVAGAIGETVTKFSNSPWILDQHAIKTRLSLTEFHVVNDFYALAAGVEYLRPDDLVSIKPGVPKPNTPKLVIGPGTGLGQAIIVPTAESNQIVATEGGHIAFAPRTEREFDVVRFIAREHPRVSVERLLSGRGLVNIHRALCVLSGVPRVSLRASEITAAAQAKSLPIAVEAVDMFCNILGRVVGDAVLSTGATGGVYLGGGILPKIIDIFTASNFVDMFLDKGRMHSFLEPVPVSLIVTDGTAFYGAAATFAGP